MSKKRGLGKPLGALLEAYQNTVIVDKNVPNDSTLQMLPVDRLQRGQYQPRTTLDPQALEELAASIRVQGIIQPIVVSPVGADRYEIIAGERRWRAAQLAGLTEVPVIIRNIPGEAAMAMSLIENIQREDLNPIEEATALFRLCEEFQMTHEQVASAVGKSRTAVTNLLRLLGLNHNVKTLLERGDLEMGHARTLLVLPFEEQYVIAKSIVDKNLSVRETEQFVKQLQMPKIAATVKPADPDVARLEEHLSDIVGAKVIIQSDAKGKGKITIYYHSLDELDGILNHIQ